ncbi:FAD-dependent oxidoreductase [Lederbergia sp. NSJ-179]|uniref:FAD-dependent oxidoreductase n=1 Tax=Lederbergia sp. NSJ-179 TaxID=2931402 RepID=UPI001FD35F03|nr:FAD-dependent oxidoreductase [Lederbergia sp. NSJ-179]MCJ7840733.1 FAD-dependent oxidoreductase [Lederbergia sp. NSJ-179]
MKVIVVGATHGGYEAVEALQSIYPDAEVQWYEKGDIDPLVVGNSKNDAEKDIHSIRGMSLEEMKQCGIYVFDNTEITKVEPDKHQVEVLSHVTGKTWRETYDKIILSPGAHPSLQSVPGNDLKNIGTMSNRQDIVRMKKHSEDPAIKNVVVVGAGHIGIGAAQVFSEAGKNVTVVDINDRPLSRYLDKELTDILQQELTDRNATLALDNIVTAFVGDDHGRVTEVVTKKGTYPADLVIMSIGNRPNTAWLEGAVELLPDGLIKTDEYLRTSEPDVFAIGDATTVQYNPGQTTMSIALATNARRQARYAVRNLEEAKHPFPGVQGSSAMQAFGYKFATTGLTEKIARRLGIQIKSVYWEQDTLITHSFSTDNKTHVMFKLIYDPKTLEILGGQIMSEEDMTAHIHAISIAIQAHFTVEQLAYADFFFQPGLNTPWNVLNMAGLKALQQENRA